MKRLLKIDKGIYEADDNTKTYRFLKRNPEWELTGKMKMNITKDHLMVIKGFSEMAKKKSLSIRINPIQISSQHF